MLAVPLLSSTHSLDERLRDSASGKRVRSEGSYSQGSCISAIMALATPDRAESPL